MLALRVILFRTAEAHNIDRRVINNLLDQINVVNELAIAEHSLYTSVCQIVRRKRAFETNSSKTYLKPREEAGKVRLERSFIDIPPGVHYDNIASALHPLKIYLQGLASQDSTSSCN